MEAAAGIKASPASLLINCSRGSLKQAQNVKSSLCETEYSTLYFMLSMPEWRVANDMCIKKQG